jgi:hypothetical protein
MLNAHKIYHMAIKTHQHLSLQGLGNLGMQTCHLAILEVALPFSTLKVTNVLMARATFWAIFSQARPVTLTS